MESTIAYVWRSREAARKALVVDMASQFIAKKTAASLE